MVLRGSSGVVEVALGPASRSGVPLRPTPWRRLRLRHSHPSAPPLPPAVLPRATTAGCDSSCGPGLLACELLPSEVSSYLEMADKNRARGHYDDAAREYNAVLGCDRHNARAESGLNRIKQAKVIHRMNNSEDEP